MYQPVKDGIDQNALGVVYNETLPPSELSALVHCFWELKTQTSLPEDFRYHVLPDACVNILFDQLHPEITDITALQMEHKVLNLGKHFHFVGIQLLPGVWQGKPQDIKNDLVEVPYSGSLDLVEMNRKLNESSHFDNKHALMVKFIQVFIQQGLVEKNTIVMRILSNIDEIQSVADMAKFACLSTRQLQRQLKKSVWLSPHDFLKILRVQQTFNQDYLDYYVDQSHYIHSFRKITGYTPNTFTQKFDV